MIKVIFLFLICFSLSFSQYCRWGNSSVSSILPFCEAVGADKRQTVCSIIGSSEIGQNGVLSVRCSKDGQAHKYVVMQERIKNIKDTEEYKNFIAMALSRCGDGSNGAHAYIGDTYKYADGVIEYTDCSSGQIEKYTIDYMKEVSSGTYRSYDGTDETKQENFLKAIITEPDSVTGNFTLPINNLCEGKKCRVTSAVDVALPAIKNGCVANKDQSKMFCINTSDEINRVDNNDTSSDKIIIDNQKQDIYTETSNNQAIKDQANNNDFDSGVDNTGGDNTGGDNTGGDNTGGDNTGGDNTGGDNTGENDSDEDIKNPYDETNTSTMQESIADFQNQLYNGNNIISAVGALSFSDNGGSCEPIIMDIAIFNKALSTDLHCRLMSNASFSTNMRLVFMFGWIIMGLFLILKL
jgi:hypothetical protein